MTRIVEVYAGAYASGKSETSINRARQFAIQHKKITLVDLDTVEPTYTLRPLAGELEENGINVIAQLDYCGIGTAGSYITPLQINCLNAQGDIVIDVGYGASGLDILDVVNNIEKEKNLKIYLVINTSKYETCSVENIVEDFELSQGLEKRTWKKFSGIISNTHTGDETPKEDVIKGYEIIKKASKIIGVPVRAIGVDEKMIADFDFTYDGVDVWIYKRFMPRAFW